MIDEEDAVQMIVLVLKDLGDQSGTPVGESFPVLIVCGECGFFMPDRLPVFPPHRKTSFGNLTLLLGEFRYFRIDANELFFRNRRRKPSFLL